MSALKNALKLAPLVIDGCTGSGHPPDDWNPLLAEARVAGQGQRLQRFATSIAP